MLTKKSKILIYILLFLLVVTIIFPIYSLAIDEDSIYVWSNNTSSIPTANAAKEAQSIIQDNSRKFLRYHFRWCYINRSKNWKHTI